MSRPGKKAKLPPFVALTWNLLNSEAYKKLPRSAAKALPFFLGKPHIAYSNRQIHEHPFEFSYREANRCLGFHSATYHKVIKDLVAYGFIDPVRKGGWPKIGNQFSVSRRWDRYGKGDFQELRWDDSEQPKK